MQIKDVAIDTLKCDNDYSSLCFLGTKEQDSLKYLIDTYDLYLLPLIDLDNNVLFGHTVINSFKISGKGRINVIVLGDLLPKDKYKSLLCFLSSIPTLNFLAILGNWIAESNKHEFNLTEKVGIYDVLYLNNMSKFDWPSEDVINSDGGFQQSGLF